MEILYFFMKFLWFSYIFINVLFYDVYFLFIFSYIFTFFEDP